MTRFYIQHGQIKYKRPALRINEMINTGGTPTPCIGRAP